ncbi:MAG: GNAT family N-acyltransferase [Myxococcota bacterium]
MSCITPPPGALTRKRYLLRFAQDAADLRAVQRLRFEVFNLELGEGLDSAYALGRDEDVYDDACHHLMVIERDAGVVGTYRMQTAAIARAGRGFYAATEFDLSPLQADVLEQGVEVGRACIAAEHRSGRVLSLLWQGLAHYMSWQQKRYLFGCCSVPAISKAVGRDLFQALQGREGLFSPHTVRPLPDLDCRMADDLTDDLAEDVTPLAPLPPQF